jgi:LacI family transcriptional regulator
MTPAKKVSVHDIARHAHVSIGTVDRALHGRKEINGETRQRILRIAHELGYKPNLAARLLAVGRAPLCIGVCIPREIHFFYDQVRRGIMEEARRFESLGVSILYRPAQRLGAGEVERARELLDSDIRALILAPGDPRGLAPLIEEAEKRGIRVLCVSSDAPGTPRSTVICVDPELNGRCAAELMAKFVPPNSRVAIVTGMLQVEDHRRKTKGFCQAFPRFCRGGKVIDIIENHEDEEEARQKCASLLERFPSIDGLYVSTANCLPVCAALDAAGLSGKVRLITTDLFPKMVPYFKNGTISASIYQRPHMQGQAAVRVAVDHIVNGVPIPPSYYLNLQIVLQSNLGLFREISSTKAAERTEPASESPLSTLVAGAR